MAGLRIWLLCALIIGNSVVGYASRPVPLPIQHAGHRWARHVSHELISNGAPPNIVSGAGQKLLSMAMDRLLQDIKHIPRNVVFVELFAGTAGITRAVQTFGLTSFTVERDDHDWQDVCTIHGTMYALFLVSSVITGGTVWMAPQCSTFWNGCRFHTGQISQNPAGDELRKDCVEANYCALLVWEGFQIKQH